MVYLHNLRKWEAGSRGIYFKIENGNHSIFISIFSLTEHSVLLVGHFVNFLTVYGKLQVCLFQYVNKNFRLFWVLKKIDQM